MLHSNHQHLVSLESANGCTEKLLMSERRRPGRWRGRRPPLQPHAECAGLPVADLESTEPVLICGSEQRHRCTWTGTSALTIGR